jgi:DNA-binding protein YbaB
MEGNAWLRGYRQQLEDIGKRTTQAKDALGEVSGTASAANGAVTVTVNSFGALQSLSFSERAADLSRPRLAEAVLEATRKAHRDAARRCTEALSPIIGGSEAEQLLLERIPAQDHLGGSDSYRGGDSRGGDSRDGGHGSGGRRNDGYGGDEYRDDRRGGWR